VVRETVAQSRARPPDVLALFARDPDPTVRIATARNRHTPIETLIKLLGDQTYGSVVAREAAANPNLPRSTLALWQLVHDTV
jgi:hypothetical protein